MSPIQIALLLLAVAGVWAIAELALTLRKTRNVCIQAGSVLHVYARRDL